MGNGGKARAISSAISAISASTPSTKLPSDMITNSRILGPCPTTNSSCLPDSRAPYHVTAIRTIFANFALLKVQTKFTLVMDKVCTFLPLVHLTFNHLLSPVSLCLYTIFFMFLVSPKILSVSIVLPRIIQFSLSFILTFIL